ncbi:MAG: orotidine 5'-phosphate decarboxylase / HUMPS family protein [Nocardioides sp.]
MDIQVALDRLPLDRAVEIAALTAPHAEWIEVGTSLIKQFGEAAIRRVVEASEGTPVLADLKTVDDVRFEFGVAFDSGAQGVTVLGLAPEVTLDGAVEAAGGRGAELVVDLMGLTPRRVEELAARLHAEVVLAPHVSKDAQAGGARVQDLLGDWATGRRIALAGGLTAEDLPSLREVPGLRVIVGSAVTKAGDPLAALMELRRAGGKEEA